MGRAVAVKGVIKCCRIKAADQKDYVSGLFEHLGLKEMTAIMKLVKSGRFSFDDLQSLVQARAEEAAAQAEQAAAQKAQQAAIPQEEMEAAEEKDNENNQPSEKATGKDRSTESKKQD